jgi:hypothetical protein
MILKRALLTKYHFGYLVFCIEKQEQSSWLGKTPAVNKRFGATAAGSPNEK